MKILVFFLFLCSFIFNLNSCSICGDGPYRKEVFYNSILANQSLSLKKVENEVVEFLSQPVCNNLTFEVSDFNFENLSSTARGELEIAMCDYIQSLEKRGILVLDKLRDDVYRHIYIRKALNYVLVHAMNQDHPKWYKRVPIFMPILIVLTFVIWSNVSYQTRTIRNIINVAQFFFMFIFSQEFAAFLTQLTAEGQREQNIAIPLRNVHQVFMDGLGRNGAAPAV